MWLLFFCIICAIVRKVSVESEIDIVLHKCCPDKEALLTFANSEENKKKYDCKDRDYFLNNYDISIIPLTIGVNISVQYGLPKACSEMQTTVVTSNEVEAGFKKINDHCYDRLVLDIFNDKIKDSDPKIVTVSCKKNEPRESSGYKFTVHRFRKCCPNGLSYDSELHVCRNSSINTSEDWLLKKMRVNESQILDVDYSLSCRPGEFSVEVKEHQFSMNLSGSLVIANGKDMDTIPTGDWCIDREFGESSLIARVCIQDCSKYNALCLKKCCQIGYHFEIEDCDSIMGNCIPSNEVLFDVNDYVKQLNVEDSHVSGLVGIGTGLACKGDRRILTKSDKLTHRLLSNGQLLTRYGTDYCFDTLDRRTCKKGNLKMGVITCYQKSVNQYYDVSFICLTISSVFLALTLIAYLTMPALQNLYGRSLMCHISMMLLAFCCLASVQYSYVPSHSLCVMLAYGIYFGFMAAFAWLNVICFDLWCTLGTFRTINAANKISIEKNLFIRYSIYAWSLPTVFSVAVFLFDRYPVSYYLDANMGEGRCWFGIVKNTTLDWPQYIFYIIPVGTISTINFGFWILTTRNCSRVKSEVHRFQVGSVIGNRARNRYNLARAKYTLTGKLWIIMGVSWMFDILSTVIKKPVWLWTVLVYVNELQGVFIFLILLCKPTFFNMLKNRLRVVFNHSRCVGKKSHLIKLGPIQSGGVDNAAVDVTTSTICTGSVQLDEVENAAVDAPTITICPDAVQLESCRSGA